MSGDLRVMNEKRYADMHYLEIERLAVVYLAEGIGSQEFYERTTALIERYRDYVVARLWLWKKGYIDTPLF